MWCKHVNTSTKQVSLFKKYEFKTDHEIPIKRNLWKLSRYVISIRVAHPFVCDLKVYCRNK